MERNQKIIKVSVWGIIVNVILVLFKALVGFITNSIAIILDAVNNLSDVLSSIITIVGTKLSRKRPDKEHPYGHGRIEYFTSLIIAIIVLAAGVTAFKESFEKIINPVKASYTVASLIIIIVAVLVKFFFGRYVRKQGEELNSGSLIASGTDAISDAVLSFSTFVAAIISMIWGVSLEGYLGIIIAVIIIKSAIEILKDNVNDMIGVRADSETTKKLREKILSYEGVLGVYDMVLHNYGPNNIIATAHIQVSDTTNAREIHRLTRTIATDVYTNMGITLTLGIYASNDSGEFKEIHHYIHELAKQYEHIIQIHGFYVDEIINLVSFDVIFSFDELEPDKIVAEMQEQLKKRYPEYEYHIIIDTDISD